MDQAGNSKLPGKGERVKEREKLAKRENERVSKIHRERRRDKILRAKAYACARQNVNFGG